MTGNTEMNILFVLQRYPGFGGIESVTRMHVSYTHLIVTYPRTAMNREKVLSAQYRAAYECAHRVVLLSKGFIKPYSEFAKLQDTSKFTIIPNGLSFNLSAHYEDLTKHKVVLIVSRLDETQKRLSLALRIWKKVKQNPVDVYKRQPFQCKFQI